MRVNTRYQAIILCLISTMFGCQEPTQPNARDRDDSQPTTTKAEKKNMDQAIDELKKLNPNSEWHECKFKDCHFIACAKDLPTFGNSRISIGIWKFNTKSQQFESVCSTTLSFVGRVSFKYDNDGLLTVVGAARNKYRDTKVFSIDLSCIE